MQEEESKAAAVKQSRLLRRSEEQLLSNLPSAYDSRTYTNPNSTPIPNPQLPFNADKNSKKRPRTVWTTHLHKKFVDAIRHLGVKNATPKRIMETMNVDGLSSGSVSSHLQQYRIYLNNKKKTDNGVERSSSTGTLSRCAAPSGCIEGSFLPHSAAMQQQLHQFMNTSQIAGNVGAGNGAFHGGLFNMGAPIRMDNGAFHGGLFNMGAPIWMVPPISMRPPTRTSPTRVGPMLEEERSEIECREIKDLPLFPTGQD